MWLRLGSRYKGFGLGITFGTSRNVDINKSLIKQWHIYMNTSVYFRAVH